MERLTTAEDNRKTEENYKKLYDAFKSSNIEHYSERYSLFKTFCPLVKDLICTVYGSFEEFLKSGNNQHPFEEYIISFDESMIDDHMVRTIALRMGFFIPNTNDRAYEKFVEDIVEIIHYSKFSREEYSRIINMNRDEFKKINQEYHYDDRLFAFMKIKRDNEEYFIATLK